MSAKSVAGVLVGSIVGAAAGFAAGVLLAPRTGAESRAMAADAVNDAWDTAVDSYERGTRIVNEKISATRPDMGATTDELRAKVDLARERMDQLRDSLSENVTSVREQRDRQGRRGDRLPLRARGRGRGRARRGRGRRARGPRCGRDARRVGPSPECDARWQVPGACHLLFMEDPCSR